MESLLQSLNFREIGVFNSREIAILVVAIIALVWICIKVPATIKDLGKVIKSFFQETLVKLYFSALLYSIIPVVALIHFGYWESSLIKDLLFWFFFSAFPLMFRVVKCENSFFKNAFLDNIKFAVIVEFIVGQNTFNIFIEILLVVFCVLLGGMMAVSEKSEEHKSVNKAIKGLATIIGLTLTFFALYSLFQNISTFITVKKLEEFSLPIILGIWFIPFLYSTHLYIQYENVFCVLNRQIRDKSALKLAKTKSIIYHKTNISSLYRWKDSIILSPPKTREDVLISFLDFEKQLLIEQNPPEIDPSLGWCPYQAKDFLSTKGISTGHYKKVFDNEWQAISPYMKLGDDIIENNLAYYVMGDSHAASHLKLVLNVYSNESEDFAIDKFVECARAIFDRAIKGPLPTEILVSIYNKIEANFTSLNKVITVRKTSHQRNLKAYTLVFELKTVSSVALV